MAIFRDEPVPSEEVLMLKRLPYLMLMLFLGALAVRGQGAKAPDQVEKVHSRLFRKGPVGQIPAMLSKSTGDVHVPCVPGVVQRIQMPLVDELGMLTSESDLVVLGKTVQGTSHLNADKDFIYSDWNFSVEEVLKDNIHAAVQPGATILVTRPGGKLQMNGRTVYANCTDFLDFESGQQYLLYLRFVPETGAYAIDGGSRAFAVSTTRRLDSVNYYKPEASDKDTLLEHAREGAAIRRSGGSK
jgi:hypothetical protein